MRADQCALYGVLQRGQADRLVLSRGGTHSFCFSRSSRKLVEMKRWKWRVAMNCWFWTTLCIAHHCHCFQLTARLALNWGSSSFPTAPVDRQHTVQPADPFYFYFLFLFCWRQRGKLHATQSVGRQEIEEWRRQKMSMARATTQWYNIIVQIWKRNDNI